MFDTILGHQSVKTSLGKDLRNHSFHQSYLFSGPAYIGKMILVQEFSSLIATGQPFDQKSPFATAFLAGQGPNLLTFLDHGESLKIEEIRTIHSFISRRTQEGRFSLCVIEHLERLTHSAANAFLKNLEEPTPQCIYLLTTRHEQSLLPTIRSRVQLYRCSNPPFIEVRHFLEKGIQNEPLIQEVLKLSQGRIGLALALAKDETLLTKYRMLWDFAVLVLEKDVVEKFSLAEHLAGENFSDGDLSTFLGFLALKLRREEQQRFLPTLERTLQLHHLFSETQVNKRLALENLFLKL